MEQLKGRKSSFFLSSEMCNGNYTIRLRKVAFGKERTDGYFQFYFTTTLILLFSTTLILLYHHHNSTNPLFPPPPPPRASNLRNVFKFTIIFFVFISPRNFRIVSFVGGQRGRKERPGSEVTRGNRSHGEVTRLKVKSRGGMGATVKSERLRGMKKIRERINERKTNGRTDVRTYERTNGKQTDEWTNV